MFLFNKSFLRWSLLAAGILYCAASFLIQKKYRLFLVDTAKEMASLTMDQIVFLILEKILNTTKKNLELLILLAEDEEGSCSLYKVKREQSGFVRHKEENITILDEDSYLVSSYFPTMGVKAEIFSSRKDGAKQIRKILKRYEKEIELAFIEALWRRRFERECQVDALTGLPNRKLFEEAVKKELQKLNRYGGVDSLIFIDLNNFKIINDTYGHQAGDRVLTSFADILRKNTRSSDTCSRLSGDEFAIMLLNSDRPTTEQKMRQLQENTHHIKNILGIDLSFSYGVFEMRGGIDLNYGTIMDDADRSMYENKRKKKIKK